MKNSAPNCEGPVKPLSDSSLTEEILQKARDELNETDEVREKCLRELRILIGNEADLVADQSDDFLLQFLRARKFRTNATFSQIKKFYKHRLMYPKLYKCYSPKQNLKVLKANLLNFQPHRTPEGSAIWIARIGSWNPEEFDYEQFLRFGLLLTEKALQNPVTQICGIVTIVDFQGLSWTHLLNMPPSSIKCFVQASQDSFPIRHKAIHVINNPSLFGLLFSILSRFLTNTIKKRIHFHGYNLESLYQYVPRALLPEEFGGTQGPFKNDEFYNTLLDSEKEFLESQKFGYVPKH